MSETTDPISAGIRAAALLEEACRMSAARARQTEVVRQLAHDLGRQLDKLSRLAREDAAPDVLAEAAICCADLANLAACNAPDLPPDAALRATEATHLAAKSVSSIAPVIEGVSGDLHSEHARNLLRDVRSARWRAEFAASLADQN